ncbi:MAG TPA: hypothetical protein VMU01_04495, partial [Rhizomicrobium sp.]|nr:hypothetical protein [Rhizomicrobium sp.]
MTATLKKYLGGKFTFVDLPYDRAKLAAFRPTMWHAGELTRLLKTLPNADVDAFLVVYPQVESGIQLESGHFNQNVLWVRYVMELIDSHTYKTIASSTSRYQIHEGGMPEFPGRVLGDEFKLDDKLTVSPENLEKLRALTDAMLEVTLTETVRSLQFGVALPPVGDHSLLPAPPVKSTEGVKTIAIASAIGDRLLLHVPGGTFTKDTDVKIPIADWGLDADVEAAIRGLLSKDYAVKDVPVDRAALAQKWWVMNGKEATVAVPQTQDVDAYLLVVKDERKILSGLGLWHDGNWVSDWTYLAANYLVLLVDAHTLKPIIGRVAVMSSKSASGFPSEKLPNGVWPNAKSLDTLPPGAKPVIRDAAMHLLKDSLGETLYQMGMKLEDGAMPAA